MRLRREKLLFFGNQKPLNQWIFWFQSIFRFSSPFRTEFVGINSKNGPNIQFLSENMAMKRPKWCDADNEMKCVFGIKMMETKNVGTCGQHTRRKDNINSDEVIKSEDKAKIWLEWHKLLPRKREFQNRKLRHRQFLFCKKKVWTQTNYQTKDYRWGNL